VPVIVWVLLAALGIPFVLFAGCMVCVVVAKSRAPVSATTTASASASATASVECDRYRAKFEAMADAGSEDLPFDQAMAKVDGWIADADNGQRACLAAGRTGDAKGLAAAGDAARKMKRDAVAAAANDPANCLKGQTLIDAKTGKTIPCTGSVVKPHTTSTAAAGSDDDDIHTRCKKFQDDWDGVTIIRCKPYFPDHRGIAVTVASSSWAFLGENGRHEAFTKAVLDSYKSHWKQFHSWNGEDAPGHQVQIYEGGVDEKIVATMSATGFYTGD
jgi:hypothetical protein